jgi:formylglycine-generating enzyme required for sulfatase activity
MGIHGLVGQRLDEYELRELLGVGGMGAVYRAYQPGLRRYVAIKVLSEALAEDPGYAERFTREARTAAALEHPHIVPIYDYGTQGDLSYVVMRLLTGGALLQRIRWVGDRLSLPSLGETADLLKQLAGALDYAHSQGVIHRDIKPSNVMFDNHGNAFLVDFGIAKLTQETSPLTDTGAVLGTPTYMAPEQWRAEPPTPATDLYAVGAMAYQLVTGQVPFDAPTPYGMMHKHLNELPTPPQALRSDVPEAVGLVLERALAKQPEDRFPTVTAFAQAFERAASGATGTRTGFFAAPLPQTPPTSPAPPPSTRVEPDVPPLRPAGKGAARSPLVWGVAILLALAAVIVVAVLASGGGEKKGTEAGMVPTTAPPSTAEDSRSPEPPTATAGAMVVLLPSDTPAPEPSLTPTEAPSSTLFPSNTPDVQATADALLALRLTQTAESWTDTPTPDIEASVMAAMTGTALSWTDTPTPTDTSKPTATATLTSSPTATLTPPPTPTATLTSSPMPTPTQTFTVTPSPTLIPPPTWTPTATPSPRLEFFEAGTRNAVWTPIVRDFNGVPLVYVPAGCLMMGSTSGDSDELPVHHVCLRTFWIGQTEVTNAQYRACVDAGACTPPADRMDYDTPAYAGYPVADVSWEQAAAYARWFGGSLPTEAQWEYAARGPEGWLFPWGPSFDASRLNFCDAACGVSWRDGTARDGYAGLAPVGSYPGGASWAGALDMAGNAWEWTADWYGEAYYATLPDGAWDPSGPSAGALRVLRGGSWFNDWMGVRASYRGWVDPEYLHPSLGFRVVLPAS